MELNDYLDGLPHGGRRDFAKRVKQSPSFLWQVANKKRSCPEGLAVDIERESQGQVTADVLIPERADYFAYLRQAGKLNAIASAHP